VTISSQRQTLQTWPVAQLRFRLKQRVYGFVRLRVKYQIAAAATITSRIIHHQAAIPLPGVAAASPVVYPEPSFVRVRATMRLQEDSGP
jgi:hypothetical protein